MLTFDRLVHDRSDRIAIAPCSVVIAGWAGRDQAAIEHHVEELAALGIPRPSSTPLFYRVAAANLTQAEQLVVLGSDSSGEVEPVIVSLADGLWVGIGSDHTDRKAEAVGIALSKQMCGKPVGRALWSYAEVEGHWDRLELRSWSTIGGERVLYQEGALTALRTPRDLMARYSGADANLAPGTVMYCGTLGAIGGIRGGSVFEMELFDPILNRRLTHSYALDELPVIS